MASGVIAAAIAFPMIIIIYARDMLAIETEARWLGSLLRSFTSLWLADHYKNQYFLFLSAEYSYIVLSRKAIP
jgi:hypothetical protein